MADIFLLVNHDLGPMTFVYKLDLHSSEITRCANMNLVSEGFRMLSSDIHT